MEKCEVSLVRAGVEAAVAALRGGLHSEDDHGYDLICWLEKRVDKIVEDTCGKIDVGRAMVVD